MLSDAGSSENPLPDSHFVFWLCANILQRARGALGLSFIREAIPFMRVPSLWPDWFPKAQPPSNMTLEIRFQYELGRGNTVYSSPIQQSEKLLTTVVSEVFLLFLPFFFLVLPFCISYTSCSCLIALGYVILLNCLKNLGCLLLKALFQNKLYSNYKGQAGSKQNKE